MKEQMRNLIANVLEDVAGDILSSMGCKSIWGEVELPECMREELEEEE